MADNHSKEVRSMNMSHIKSTDTKPEVIVRKYLFSKGLRYRSNQEYWIPKLQRNVERDKTNIEKLTQNGWKVITIWECELKKERFIPTLEKLFEIILNNI